MAAEADRQTLVAIAQEIADLFDECVRTGAMTDRAADLVAQATRTDAPLVLAFVEKLSRPAVDR